jgi:CMD domain protein
MSEPTATTSDIIDRLAGIQEGSPLANLRALRPEVARYAQGSYEALLEPADPAGISLVERHLIALSIATLERSDELREHHRQRLAELGAAPELIEAAQAGTESAALTPRHATLLRHAKQLTLDPAASTKTDLETLSALGLTPREIVIVSQLIAFVTFQVRVLAGLRIIGGSL